jgi:hypothetical protein
MINLIIFITLINFRVFLYIYLIKLETISFLEKQDFYFFYFWMEGSSS